MAAEVALGSLPLIMRAASGAASWPSRVHWSVRLFLLCTCLCPAFSSLSLPRLLWSSSCLHFCTRHRELGKPSSPGFKSELQDLQALSVRFNILNLGKFLNLSEPSPVK